MRHPAEFYRDALRRAYEALPTTVEPQEFIDGSGNWGLAEPEYNAALIIADALTAKRS